MKLYKYEMNFWLMLIVWTVIGILESIFRFGEYLTGEEYFSPRLLFSVAHIVLLIGAFREWQICQLALEKRHQFADHPDIDQLIPPNTKRYMVGRILQNIWINLLVFIGIGHEYFYIPQLSFFYIWNVHFYVWGKPIPNLLIWFGVLMYGAFYLDFEHYNYDDNAILKSATGGFTSRKRVKRLEEIFPNAG